MSAPLPSQALDSLTDEKKAVPLSSEGPPGYQATAYEAAAYEVPPPPPPAHTEPERRSRCRRRCRRFGHIFIALLFLWLGARYLFRHCGLRRFGSHGPHHSHWGPAGDYEDDEHPKGPRHDIDVCVDSADWTEYTPDEGRHPHRYEAWRKTELSLPSTTDDIFLISRGFNAMGVLRVNESADREDIGVEVIVGFHENSDAFEKAQLCTLRRGDDGHGVGIFIPRFRHHFHRRDTLFFNITVSLPEGKGVTTIPHFATHMPMFTQIVEKLPTHNFGSVSLHSAHSPIVVEDLVGNKIRVHSKGGPIAGTFNTTSSLDIKTCNSPIRAAVNAFNHDNAAPTKVNIATNNSPLRAELALFSTHTNQRSGVFAVRTHTSNSPLAVNFTEQPLDSVLKLEAHTTNSPAHVHLHPAFEGVFKLRTSILPAVVHYDEGVEDPAGLGRKRVVHVKSVGRFAKVVHGDVEWVPQGQGQEVAPAGKVDVSTSHSPLRLLL